MTTKLTHKKILYSKSHQNEPKDTKTFENAKKKKANREKKLNQ